MPSAGSAAAAAGQPPHCYAKPALLLLLLGQPCAVRYAFCWNSCSCSLSHFPTALQACSAAAAAAEAALSSCLRLLLDQLQQPVALLRIIHWRHLHTGTQVQSSRNR
jgi:hypothetical protein